MVTDLDATTHPVLVELAWMRALIEPYMRIHDVTAGALGGKAVRFRGELTSPSGRVYARLAPAMRSRGRTLTMHMEDDEAVLMVLDGVARPKPNNRWLPLLLAGLTFISMVFTYALLHTSGEHVSWSGLLSNLGDALAFTISLLVILVTHELGHFFVARRFGVAVSLPFLIPLPLSLLGTMGAIIQMKEVPPNRKAMLYIGAAGPLAGLAVGIPILIVGIALSQVTTLPSEGGYLVEGNSLLYAGLKYLIKGEWLPSGARDIMLHPVALAGWAGVLVTALNLIPAGQLDGGHVARAALGQQARKVTWAVIAVLLPMGLLWQGWFIWAALIFVFSRAEVRPLDDITPLERHEKLLAACLMLLALLTFTPIPIRIF